MLIQDQIISFNRLTNDDMRVIVVHSFISKYRSSFSDRCPFFSLIPYRAAVFCPLDEQYIKRGSGWGVETGTQHLQVNMHRLIVWWWLDKVAHWIENKIFFCYFFLRSHQIRSIKADRKQVSSSMLFVYRNKINIWWLKHSNHYLVVCKPSVN